MINLKDTIRKTRKNKKKHPQRGIDNPYEYDATFKSKEKIAKTYGKTKQEAKEIALMNIKWIGDKPQSETEQKNITDKYIKLIQHQNIEKQKRMDQLLIN